MLLAQISDIHASSVNNNLARLRAVINWLVYIQPNAVIVTGDLADDCWSDAYQEIQVQLLRLKCPFFIIPGNSDNLLLMRKTMCQVAGWDLYAVNLHFTSTFDGLRLIGVDTSVKDKVYGNILSHLDWLERKFNEVPAIPTILFTHHHLFLTGIDPVDTVMCKGAKEFQLFLLNLTTRPIAICSGHVHRAMFSVVADVPSHICGSICVANPLQLDINRSPPITDPPALMIHDFRYGHLVSSHVSISEEGHERNHSAPE